MNTTKSATSTLTCRLCPDDVALLLANWISAYNQMVALDPVLSKADEARLGPDAKKNLVSPKQGRALAQSALEEGAATEEAVNALEEEAKVAPQVPDADNRNSVRHSEAQKNFVRTIVRGVVSTAKLGWKHKGKLTMGAGGSVAAAKWVLANQVTLLEMFANNPTMHQVSKTLIEFLKTMPLA